MILSHVTEAAFSSRRRADWEALDDMVHRAIHRGLRHLSGPEIARLPTLYRDVCADLARAQAASYSAPLLDYLQALTASAHTVVYGAHAKGRLANFRTRMFFPAFEAFPRAVRRHKWAMLIAFILFFGPFFGGLATTLLKPDFAFHLVPEQMLQELTKAYTAGFDGESDPGQRAGMFGFYIHNNVGIALRCFALGITFGIGSAFALVYNGLWTGAIVGYVASQGAGDNIVTFIVGHGSFELGAIILAGGAGLSLGWSIVAPKSRTRLESLQIVAKDVMVIVFGAAIMLFAAAGIEGFWSGSGVPAVVKRSIGVVFFVLISTYLLVVGRGRAASDDVRSTGEASPWT